MSRRSGISEALRQDYAEWQWRSAGVWAAYERWTQGGGNLEFASYTVALDLEETACLRYMEIARQA